VRVILDANVLISALLSPSGAPARIVVAWQQGRFDLIVSPLLLAELRRALAYPKLRRRITADEADEFVDWLSRSAVMATDPEGVPTIHSDDPGDDYLLALAAVEDAVLVSGDEHLLALASDLPIRAPADFLALLDARA
jgi:putative PIN family toxin of toxin-antitoxin system